MANEAPRPGQPVPPRAETTQPVQPAPGVAPASPTPPVQNPAPPGRPIPRISRGMVPLPDPNTSAEPEPRPKPAQVVPANLKGAEPRPEEFRRPDAIRCPRNWPLRPTTSVHINRKILFAPIFGSKLVHSTEFRELNESILTPEPCPNYYYGKVHPWAGEDAYTWYVARYGPDGKTWIPGEECCGHPAEDRRIKLGYLKDDPYRADPEVLARQHADYDARWLEYRTSPEYRQKMIERGIMPIDSVTGEDFPEK